MKRAPAKAIKSVSHAGYVKTVSIRIQIRKTSVMDKATVKTK